MQLIGISPDDAHVTLVRGVRFINISEYGIDGRVYSVVIPPHNH